MTIAIFGDSCVGKSTIAQRLREQTSATLFSGKDYLRLAKNEAVATKLFRQTLCGDETVIYVISEKEQLALLPQNCLRVLVVAGLEQIKERFAQRMHGQLPPPVAAMLERKYGQFENEAYDLRIDTRETAIESACTLILEKI